MEALLASLPDRYQPFHVFRPYRDVRFSKDKSPYKTMHGAASETEGGASHGLFVSRAGLFVGAGMYQMARDQIERFRASVAADATGSSLQRIIDDLEGHRVRVYSGHDDPLTTAPRGYPKDHPRIGLLRWKACIAAIEIGSASVLHSARVRHRILDMWEQSEPLMRWLEDNVGPSSAPR